ncbi:MAG: hypothetical protein GXO83_06380 [Chlorobi bacterium]|nr:hypothetical protein [Chlorobiota bacterium]
MRSQSLFNIPVSETETFSRIFRIGILTIFISAFSPAISSHGQEKTQNDTTRGPTILVGTFLGNEQRNYYGDEAPDTLDLLWRLWLGKGETVISRKAGSRIWAGAGWTGQPLLYHKDTTLFLVQGAYDHHLKKIDTQTHRVVWEYSFDDVVKGTGTLWIQKKDSSEALIVFQGSRLGVGNYLDSPHIPSFRAISLTQEKELWRLDSKWTQSYSRDVDGSPLIIDDTLYIGLENSLFTVINPDPEAAEVKDSMLQPEIIQETKLYTRKDVKDHKYNVVTESSPSRLGNMIFITSGSGHVFRYNLKSRKIDWNFYIGSDIDGSPVITRDSCILVSIEKQYIRGPGGVFKLDPRKPEKEAVIWFFPTDTSKIDSWEGGVIGSCGINDHYIDSTETALAAFTGLDGYLYLVAHEKKDMERRVIGPDSTTFFPAPRMVIKKYIGPSISTPLIVGNKLIVAGYNGIRLFRIMHNGEDYSLKPLGRYNAPFEATPVVWGKKIFIASRDGYLYCFGKQLKSP